MRWVRISLSLVSGCLFASPLLAQKGAPAPRVEFLRDIAPILDRSGCSTAQCHGKFGGRGGFQLSLLTLSPEDDYEPIVYGARGRRVNFAAPEQSLLLLKAAGQVPHVGGPRFAPNSPEYSAFVRWIRAGAPFAAGDPRLVSLEIAPRKAMIPRVGLRQPLRVIAAYTDGSRRDVTRQCVYESTSPAVIEVGPDGVAAGRRWGGGAVIARYLGVVTASFLTIPQARKGPYPAIASGNIVDQLVFDNLKRLNVLPSAPADDHEFLRRISLDLIGRLPTAREIDRFVTDTTADKRSKIIDELLARPEFVDYRTLRLAELLRVNPRKFNNVGPLGERSAVLFYEWIWKSVADNKPWDRFVRELVTAQGSGYQNGPANFYRVERTPNDRMENLSQAFLGVRMSCARCHKHPFDRWTTDDYWNFAAFCGKVGTRGGPLYNEQVIFYNPGGRVVNQSVTGRNRGKVATAVFLGEKQAAPDSANALEELAGWMTDPRNPFFARATVNRLWAHFFGRGIIHPVDDMRVTSAESVPGLLDALSAELIKSGFDMRHMMRLLLNSRVYQLSSVPNPSNRLDDQFFSHCQPRAMPAEVLLDVLDQSAGIIEQFGSFPERSRAVQAAVPPQNQFLNAFGQSHREFLADIDPRLEPNLVQTLLMINSPYVEGKIRQGTAVAEAVRQTTTDDELVRALYLRTFCRDPRPDETRKAIAVLSDPPKSADAAAAPRPAPNPREAARLADLARRERAQDLLWALVTSREFYFNH